MSKIIKINKFFENQTKLYPNKKLIIDKNKKIIYKELNRMTNQFAPIMIKQGIQPADLVPLLVEKNIEMFIAILAILKKGATFYFFNSEQLKKISYPILEAMQAKHIVSQSNLLNHFKDYSGNIINLSNLSHILSGISEKLMPMIETIDQDMVYGILTSGTTERPKYAVITHQNLLDAYYFCELLYQLSQNDVDLQVAAGQKIYKTRDKGRFLSDENLEIFGRNPLPIKYEGKRIELSIIEPLLNPQQGINQALVTSETQTYANNPLLACFVDLADQKITHNELRKYLNESASNFIVPTKFYVVKKILPTINGKLDRKVDSQTVLKEVAPEFILPSTPLEAKLLKIWQKIFRKEKIGIQSDFRALGGFSLRCTQMIRKIRERLKFYLNTPLSTRTTSIKELPITIERLNEELSQREIDRIVIIGGGPAAISLCWQLFNEIKFKTLNKALEIIVFEKNKEIGLGLPYAQKEEAYILNLPRNIMEPIPDKKGEFSAWLCSNYPNYADKSEFPPRYIFGQYLNYLAKKFQSEAAKMNIKVSYLTSTEVFNINKNVKHYLIKSTQGDLQADYVILCTGHMPSNSYREYIGKPGYSPNPWNNDSFLKVQPNESVGILGTRLTAIDIVVKLRSQNHSGPITMISHNGLLPTVLAKKIPPYQLQYLKLDSLPDSIQLSYILKMFFKEISLVLNEPCGFDSIVKSYQDINPLSWIHKEIDQAERDAKPWQQVMFSFYPMIPDIWQRMDLENQRKFILEYSSLFMTYLAAFPLENAYKIKNLLESGQLKVVGGLQLIKQYNGKFILQGKTEYVKTDHLFNATGPGYNIKHQTLFINMLNQGLIRQHPLGGIDIKPETLQVFNSQKQLNPGLFAIGELTRGKYLMTSDLATVVKQASKVSRVISNKIMRKTIIRHSHKFCFFAIPAQIFNNFSSVHKYLQKG